MKWTIQQAIIPGMFFKPQSVPELPPVWRVTNKHLMNTFRAICTERISSLLY